MHTCKCIVIYLFICLLGNGGINRRKTESDLLSQYNQYNTGGGGAGGGVTGSQEGLEIIPEKPVAVPEIAGNLLLLRL